MLRAVRRMMTVIRLAPVTEGTASVENDVRMLAKSSHIAYIIQVYDIVQARSNRERLTFSLFWIFFLIYIHGNMNVKVNLQCESGPSTMILRAWFKYKYQVILE